MFVLKKCFSDVHCLLTGAEPGEGASFMSYSHNVLLRFFSVVGILFSCIPRVLPEPSILILPMLSHPGPDKNHVYLMHWLYRKSRIYVVK